MRTETTLQEQLDALRRENAVLRADKARLERDLKLLRRVRGMSQKRQLARDVGQFDLEAAVAAKEAQ